MSLILPDFKDRKCLELTCCGFISADGLSNILSQMKPVPRALVARYGALGQEAYMRLVLPFPMESEEGKRVHIHLIIARPESFNKTPRTNCEPDEILSRLSPFIGKEIDVNLSGMFELSAEDVPPFIRLTSVEARVKNLRVRFTGGKLVVQGAPIQTISWELPEKGGPGSITLGAKRRMPLDEKYLVTALDSLEQTFDAFVVGDRDDV